MVVVPGVVVVVVVVVPGVVVVVVVVAPAVVVVVDAGLVVVVVTAAVVVVVGAAVVVVDAALVVVDAAVVVVRAGVVVVVLPGGPHELPGPHASQQLGTDPTHAVPPVGALHTAALLLVEHVVWPVRLVVQQVTKPGLPQVDCAAQDTTGSAHSGRSDPSSTAAATTASTQLT